MTGRIGLALAAALALGTGFAHADGGKDPVKAREACEKQGRAGNPDELRKCCDNQILVEKPADQKKLVEQCVKGKAGKK